MGRGVWAGCEPAATRAVYTNGCRNTCRQGPSGNRSRGPSARTMPPRAPTGRKPDAWPKRSMQARHLQGRFKYSMVSPACYCAQLSRTPHATCTTCHILPLPTCKLVCTHRQPRHTVSDLSRATAPPAAPPTFPAHDLHPCSYHTKRCHGTPPHLQYARSHRAHAPTNPHTFPCSPTRALPTATAASSPPPPTAAAP